ncbi:hypothetical protein LHFGNBLO_006413 (plasmid) [Mesorhizobium sp. AR10]|nr:hypothetical protein LHFGNBLO_006413 [Mesorhizobium sp. AR10]
MAPEIVASSLSPIRLPLPLIRQSGHAGSGQPHLDQAIALSGQYIGTAVMRVPATRYSDGVGASLELKPDLADACANIRMAWSFRQGYGINTDGTAIRSMRPRREKAAEGATRR